MNANVDLTSRSVGTTYTLTYDAENRLTAVSGTGLSASFVFDGDGNRVKGVVNGATTVYIGNTFEWSGSTSTMKKYYYASGMRVAMRTGASTLYFILSDHPSLSSGDNPSLRSGHVSDSTSTAANTNGTLLADGRECPFGEVAKGGEWY